MQVCAILLCIGNAESSMHCQPHLQHRNVRRRDQKSRSPDGNRQEDYLDGVRQWTSDWSDDRTQTDHGKKGSTNFEKFSHEEETKAQKLEKTGKRTKLPLLFIWGQPSSVLL